MVGAALSSGAEKALESVPPGVVCQSAIMSSSAALAWLPSWCDATSSRSSPGPAPVHPGSNSDAQMSLCPWVSSAGVSITRTCRPWSPTCGIVEATVIFI